MGSGAASGGSFEAGVVRSIPQRPELLQAMLRDARRQPAIYQPGPFWRSKARAAVRQIERHGLDDFRGEDSGVGTSFADNLYVDFRTTLDAGLRRPVKFVLDRVYPFSNAMTAQVEVTRSYAREQIALAAVVVGNDPQTTDLLDRYALPDTLLGGCVATLEADGHRVSMLYINLLQMIDRAARTVPLAEARSLFEIGGGFGANVHLQLELFPHLRKIVYLDVPPNLYVGTSYLRALYGDAVRDFLETRSLDRITFRDDDELEILAICPWQIESLDLAVDVFWNANSFVEMPADVVSNYAQKVLALPRSAETDIVLATYGGGGDDTIRPADLPAAFAGRSFTEDRFWVPGWPLAGQPTDGPAASRERVLFTSTA